MREAVILRKVRILQAQNESIANTLMVLEKELVGSGASTGSTKTKEVRKKTSEFIANRRAQRKKASQ